MERLVALMVAGLFVVGALGLPAQAADQKTAAPAKSEAPMPPKPEPMEKKPLEERGAAATQVVDINRATADELKALPGVGETYAQKIVDNRPYARKGDLVKRKILPKSTYEGIKDRITAGHTSAKSR
jgi:competence protein ComEA